MAVEVSGQRKLSGAHYQVLRYLTLIVIFYHLYTVQFGQPQVLMFRSLHVAMYTSLAFIAYGVLKSATQDRVPWYDYLLSALAFAPAVFMFLDYERVSTRYPYVEPLTTLDWVVGLIAIVLAAEACRRALGLTLTLMLLFFVGHALFGPYFPSVMNQPAIGPERLIDHTFMTTAGLYGSLTGLSATYVLMFVLFGAILDCAQGGKFFMNVSALLAGRLKGGSGKVAVFASGLFGSISGSAVANVYATGSFTIPLMIRTGFRPRFAAAIEAIASSSGQLVPPIMGSAAFLIADFTGVAYFEVVKAAAIPAFLYLFAVYMMVHFEASKNQIPAMSDDIIAGAKADFFKYVHLGLPLVVIVYLLIDGRSPYNAAYWGIISTLVLAQVFPATRMTVAGVLNAFETGGRIIVPIAMSLFVAAMIISTIELTGLGLRFTALLLSVTGGDLTITLILVMLSCIILGMGLPTAAAYIIVAIFAAPALIKLGISPLSAHLFVFYYAIVSAITPPIAVAAYAAGSIAGDKNLQAVGFTAMRLGVAVYLVPFIFIATPALLLEGSWPEIAQGIVTASVGIIALAAAAQGFLTRSANPALRLLLAVSAVCLLVGGDLTDLIGFALFGLIWGFQIVSKAARKPVT
ncbi:TRAP transporter fused permease subunit [Pelagibius litoralis]|uniref:TRAP transporter fused permease subunit n=1 Tax=Pelagibius litoralis TaxID=374515 RepID=A0A967EXA4_9PROT|nr:TRAP transporter fused permease subunit [Pelagibius litoralis]NIA68525.1 TRAP transporter fused permease subunit [Pelagibius litoralis]